MITRGVIMRTPGVGFNSQHFSTSTSPSGATPRVLIRTRRLIILIPGSGFTMSTCHPVATPHQDIITTQRILILIPGGREL